MKLLLVLTPLLLVACGQAWALDQTDDIDTNRPTFHDSPLVLPSGSAQIENGTTYQGFQHDKWTYDIPENEVRVGLLPLTEFQMFTPNFVIQNAPGNNVTGVTDINEIGLKQQIKPLLKKRLVIAAIAGVNVPTGNYKLSHGSGAQPVFRIPYAYQLNKNWTTAGMQSVLVLNDGHTVQWQCFADLERAIGPKSTIFAEYGGYFTEHSFPQNIIHFGGVHKLARHHQVDLHFGFGLNSAAPTAFVGVGYSYRFDGLPWGG
jgi:hypothetical protein